MSARKAQRQSKSKQAPSAKKPWQARLTADADAATAQFVASLDVDRTLWRYDIVGSIAHARMLSERKLIGSTVKLPILTPTADPHGASLSRSIFSLTAL